jgi:hypothetical protein
MTRIIAAVEPVLEDLGYQEHDSTFIRSIQPDGLVHVVDFQHSRSGAGLIRDSGEFQARVLSPVCGPPFTVNLGVWLPGVSQFPPGPAQDMTGKAICAADCLIRDRIGRMLPDRPGDWWWPVSADGEAGEVIARALAGYGLPWLSRFTSWNEMLFRFETGPTEAPAFFAPPARLLAMRMRLARGERDQAVQDFTSQLEYLITKTPRGGPGAETASGFLGFMEQVAQAHNLDVDVHAYAADIGRRAARNPAS